MVNGSGAGSSALFTTSALSVGTHTVSAVYSGDDTFPGSSGTLSPDQIVNSSGTAIGTSVTLTSSPDPSAVGQGVAFTATVTQAAGSPGTPTGTVTFEEGTTILQAVRSTPTGHATFTTAALGAGAHTITRRLQRRRQLRGQYRDDGPDRPGGQPGHDHHVRLSLAKPVTGGTTGALHGDRDPGRRLRRHADRHRHIRGGNDRPAGRPARRRPGTRLSRPRRWASARTRSRPTTAATPTSRPAVGPRSRRSRRSANQATTTTVGASSPILRPWASRSPSPRP